MAEQPANNSASALAIAPDAVVDQFASLSVGSSSASSAPATPPVDSGTPQKDSAAPGKRSRIKPRIVLSGTVDEILARNTAAVPAPLVEKLVHRSGAAWSKFYTRHAAVQFFKDRHWTEREWDLGSILGGGEDGGAREDGEGDAAPSKDKGKGKGVLEVGCGTGAFVYPLLERYPGARFVAFDFARKAVELTKAHPRYDPSHIHSFDHDLTVPREELHTKLGTPPPEFGPPLHSFDIVSFIFVLSAIAPRSHARAVETVVSLLAPGGSLLFRDYALHDAAQLRFHSLPSASYAAVPSLMSTQTGSTSPSSSSPSSLRAADESTSTVSDNVPSPSSAADLDTASSVDESNLPWYKRGDNTFTYFFTPSDIQSLVDRAVVSLNAGKSPEDDGFIELEGKVEVVEREMFNRAEDWGCTRKFVHGSWRRVR
ncbi:hypothetical protein JCM8097_003075 [Rhodosporidiobolus ruineniae]